MTTLFNRQKKRKEKSTIFVDHFSPQDIQASPFFNFVHLCCQHGHVLITTHYLLIAQPRPSKSQQALKHALAMEFDLKCMLIGGIGEQNIARRSSCHSK